MKENIIHNLNPINPGLPSSQPKSNDDLFLNKLVKTKKARENFQHYKVFSINFDYEEELFMNIDLSYKNIQQFEELLEAIHHPKYIALSCLADFSPIELHHSTEIINFNFEDSFYNAIEALAALMDDKYLKDMEQVINKINNDLILLSYKVNKNVIIFFKNNFFQAMERKKYQKSWKIIQNDKDLAEIQKDFTNNHKKVNIKPLSKLWIKKVQEMININNNLFPNQDQDLVNTIQLSMEQYKSNIYNFIWMNLELDYDKNDTNVQNYVTEKDMEGDTLTWERIQHIYSLDPQLLILIWNQEYAANPREIQYIKRAYGFYKYELLTTLKIFKDSPAFKKNMDSIIKAQQMIQLCKYRYMNDENAQIIAQQLGETYEIIIHLYETLYTIYCKNPNVTKTSTNVTETFPFFQHIVYYQKTKTIQLWIQKQQKKLNIQKKTNHLKNN
jgi:hypothetical protein